ncbi:hypothetical protein SGQ44_10060 [Flavobacterium sp. Fl-77]|uniref:Gasdermin bGSDM n=1 Tax=Flavobacterium flavipigmentatum TaxID=2893884 RepID=A0AAJ2VXD1_9FLAO|nr:MULTISPECIES: hypothetical protein [unclassified Flavobacterium]MDX6182718.1 hypothetical protein [Flavobacterium sp. Fl-33]MDX6186103.1 hypothetical protein [Flavobacterium sp. Fl-77]UFH38252.1 hypothetical protein LNP22_16150 [Flavobacterium sp. F-70]
MKLTQFLTNQGYDLIEGPVRNHKPLQLWLKKSFDEAQLYYGSIDHAFKSDVVLTEIENPALSINTSKKDDYGFNIGITLLQEILKTLGLGAFEISAKIKSGKSVTISYDNSFTKEYAIGNLEEYFFGADFLHPNPSLLKNANQNNILLVTGVVFAKNLVADIETDFAFDAALMANLNEMVEGKIDFTKSAQNKIKMVANGEIHFPVAVKASRIDYDRSRFNKLILVTDSSNIF